MLSTRRDLLPEDVALELAKLQDRVPPFPAALSREMVERAFGLDVRGDVRPLLLGERRLLDRQLGRGERAVIGGQRARAGLAQRRRGVGGEVWGGGHAA